MNTIIRKISVGERYLDAVIHYQVGSIQRLKRKVYRITGIYLDSELFELGKVAYNVYVKEETGTGFSAEVLWKTIMDVPVVVENNIDFD